jgi:cupin fold WbuC family metalloprotein
MSMPHFVERAPEVLAASGLFVSIHPQDIEDLKQRASASPLQRARILAHRDTADSLHEMLIVQTRNVYVRPHKHFGKPESLHVIEGAAKVVFFNDTGDIEEVLDVGPASAGTPFFLRNGSPRYHTQIILTPYFVFHEVTLGPFRPEDTGHAPWAPEEKDISEVRSYLARLRRDLGLPQP